MPPRRSRPLRWLLAALLLTVALFLSRGWWMTALGGYLVRAEPPVPADAVLVLAGDSSGNRMLKAGELVRQGLAPKAVVSGPAGVYGFHESELAIRFAAGKGFPESYFVAAPHRGRSTKEEAEVLIPLLRSMGVRRVLLVTSDFHTRRAGAIFRRAAADIRFTVVAAPDDYFRPDAWWRNREGRKVFLIEWLKTMSEPFGL